MNIDLNQKIKTSLNIDRTEIVAQFVGLVIRGEIVADLTDPVEKGYRAAYYNEVEEFIETYTSETSTISQKLAAETELYKRIIALRLGNRIKFEGKTYDELNKKIENLTKNFELLEKKIESTNKLVEEIHKVFPKGKEPEQ